MIEQWREIKDFEKLYKISSFGNVFSIKKHKNIKPETSNNGYLRIGLHKAGKVYMKSIHRLVAETFIPNPENKPQINHKNGNKIDNCIENLEWVTPSENVSHRFSVLGHKSVNYRKFGSKNHSSKKVAQIEKDNIIAEYGSVREASRLTGILPSTIHRCIIGKYTHAGNYQWKYI